MSLGSFLCKMVQTVFFFFFDVLDWPVYVMFSTQRGDNFLSPKSKSFPFECNRLSQHGLCVRSIVCLDTMLLFAIFRYAITMSSCAVGVSLIICNFPVRHDDVQLCSCGVFDYLQFSRTPWRCPVVQLWCLWLFDIICNFPVRHHDVQLCSCGVFDYLQFSRTPWRCPVVQLWCLWLFAIFPYAMTMSSCAVVVSLIICNFPVRHDDVQLCSEVTRVLRSTKWQQKVLTQLSRC